MSHDIGERDGQQGVEMAWHGLTDVVEKITFEGSPLNWELQRRKLTYTIPDGENGEKVIEFPSDAIVASDDLLPVGDQSVRQSYGIIQNRDIWNTLQDGLSESNIPFEVVSIGSVKDRTKVFISVKLNNGEDFKIGNREFKFILNALGAHDGSGKVLIMDSGICTVCANTYGFNVNQFYSEDGAIRFAAKHSKNGGLKLINVAKGIASLGKNRELFVLALDKFGDRKVTEAQALEFTIGLIAPESADGEEKILSTRSHNIAEQIISLFKTGKGNDGENALDLFSAFTDYYTHESSGGRGKSAQFFSSEFGRGQVMKEKAFNHIADLDLFNKTVKKGANLLLLQ